MDCLKRGEVEESKVESSILECISKCSRCKYMMQCKAYCEVSGQTLNEMAIGCSRV